MDALFNKSTVVICAAGILVLSTMPSSLVPKAEVEYLDKVVHIVMYTVLAGLLFGYVSKDVNRTTSKWMMLCFLMASGYGLFIEILQHYFFESRSFEIYDIISNIIGSLLGVLLVNKFFNSKK